LELLRGIDDAQALAQPPRIERRPRECADGREVGAGHLADVAVHVIQTVVAAKTHLF
jgi:hypothetical protein